MPIYYSFSIQFADKDQLIFPLCKNETFLFREGLWVRHDGQSQLKGQFLLRDGFLHSELCAVYSAFQDLGPSDMSACVLLAQRDKLVRLLNVLSVKTYTKIPM